MPVKKTIQWIVFRATSRRAIKILQRLPKVEHPEKTSHPAPLQRAIPKLLVYQGVSAFYVLYEKLEKRCFSNKILTRGVSDSSHTLFLKPMEFPIVLPRALFLFKSRWL